VSRLKGKKIEKRNENNWETKRKKNVSRIRKKTFYLQFCMGTPEGHQKVKKNKNTYGIYPTKFASSIQKQSYRNTKSTNRNKKKLIKVCLVLQKWKEGKNSYGGYPTEFESSTQNPKKIIRTPNLSVRTNIFPKKVCLVP
jgi:hypothetical protein